MVKIKNIQDSIEEDIGTGDITADLIPEDTYANATLITREEAIICGIPWVEKTYHIIDPTIQFNWHVAEKDHVLPKQCILELSGKARALVTGERTALNWLQSLSGTATQVYRYAQQLQGTKARLLDTRKTLPGLREAQKYAVRCGGGYNHRMGLYDAFLIKENHIIACGSIAKAIHQARLQRPEKSIEIEVENLEELKQALAAKADIILLDNFDCPQIREAVAINNGQAKLEVSGNVNLQNIRAIAETGIDYISVGALTKNIQAIDFSMRINLSLG